MTVVPVISERLLQWQRQEPQGPWRLLVLPTYRCNVDCGICIRKWYPTPKFLFDELSDERWLRLVDEAADLQVRSLVIGGGGEPMPDTLVTAMRQGKATGMEGRLQTNGTRLSPESIEALVTSGWDCVSISRMVRRNRSTTRFASRALSPELWSRSTPCGSRRSGMGARCPPCPST